MTATAGNVVVDCSKLINDQLTCYIGLSLSVNINYFSVFIYELQQFADVC